MYWRKGNKEQLEWVYTFTFKPYIAYHVFKATNRFLLIWTVQIKQNTTVIVCFFLIEDVIQTLRPKAKPKKSPKFLFQNNVKRASSHVDWMLNLPTLLSQEDLKVWT